MAHLDYSTPKGERYPTLIPRDSNILGGDGSFASETQKSVDFVAKKGERYQLTRPGTSDIWKVSFGKLENKVSLETKELYPREKEKIKIEVCVGNKKPIKITTLFVQAVNSLLILSTGCCASEKKINSGCISATTAQFQRQKPFTWS